MDDEYSTGDEAEIRPADAIFTLGPNDDPIKMYLHPSLGRGGTEAVAKKIKAAGGNPTADEDDAEVIICREDRPAFKQLEYKYDHFRYVWVEPPSWVEDCIRRRKYKHVPPGKTTLPLHTRRARVEFTPEDDRHLAQYLALRLPFKEAGGRTGNGVYKELVNPDREYLYPWAKRHSWQSWRERYKKNQDVFDAGIKRMVDRDPDPPKLGHKGQYFIPGRGRKVVLRHIIEYEDEDSPESDELQEGDNMEVKEDEEMPNVILNKRPIMDHNPHHRRGDSSQPQRKKARYPVERYESEESEENNGHTHNGSKGKGRQGSDPYRVSPDRDHVALDELGPSHFDGAHIDDQPLSPQTASASANIGSQPHTSNAMPSNSPESPLPRKLPVSGRPLDAQRTLVRESGINRRPHAAPPDTQATLVHSSQPRGQSSRPARREAPDVPRRTVYPNTRAHPRPGSKHPAQAPQSSPPGKRGRGRPRKVRPPKSPSLSPVGGPSRQTGFVSPSDVVPTMDEVRVEALLQGEGAAENGNARGGDDSSNQSSDDQGAMELLARRHEQTSIPPRMSVSGNSRPPSLQFPGTPPHVDLKAHGRATSSSHKATTLRPFALNTRENAPSYGQHSDSNATPKARVPSRAAKKMASRYDPPLSSDEHSETPTDTTSFPAEPTEAWEFKTAKAPFKPGTGTRAERYARNTDKGKRRGG